jgi:hypothetical protein
MDVFFSIMTALYMCYEPVKKLGAVNNELRRGSALSSDSMRFSMSHS